MSFTLPAAPASTLAFVTTVHLALVVLRRHHRPGSGRVNAPTIVSLLFAVAPWGLPSSLGLVAGFVAHAAWFVVYMKLVPQQGVAPASDRIAPRTVGAAPTAAPSTRASVAHAPPARHPAPNTFVETSVMAVTDAAQNIRTFRFARPAGFEFVAGQFLPIRVSIAGRDHVRCYSICSSPESRAYLEISVKRQGLVSTALHSMIRPGMTIGVKTPAGGFIYPSDSEDAERPLLLLAGGIGITPLISMMRHGVAADPNRPITLLYSAPSVEALAFRDEIRSLVRGSARANAILAVTRGASSSDVYPGRIDDTLITTAMPTVADAVAMICGPQPMITGMRTTLASLGLPEARIRYEAFEAAVAIAKRGGRAAARVDDEPHEMRCAQSGLAVQVAPGQTLLEAAEAGGVAIDSLCRAGVCGTCRTRVVDGNVDCPSTTLGDADRQNGFVLACVSHPQGDCVIEA